MEKTEDGSKRFLGSKVLFILLVIIYLYWFLWGVTKFVLGIVYMNDCEDIQMIPIFILVDGFTYIPLAIGLIPFYRESSDSTKRNAQFLLIFGIILCAGWTITGSCFIYPSNKGKDCDEVVRTIGSATLGLNWGTIGIWGQLVFRALFYNGCSCC